MNLEQYIGKKMKLFVLIDGTALTYHATIISSDKDQTVFTDKFGKEFVYPSILIQGAEVIE